MKIGLIDYQAGNLRSVENALRYLGLDFELCDQADKVASFDQVIFPGDGAAGAAMHVLESSGIGAALQDFFRSGKAMLGICLGSQIVLQSSEEANTQCMGILEGVCRHFSGLIGDLGLKIPHMGWNQVDWNPEDSVARQIFAGIPRRSSFYFVHSYYTEPAGLTRTLCTCEYGRSFCAGLGRDNLLTFQFHPEKSGPIGLKLLENCIKRV